MAESLFRETEDHDRGGSFLVGDNLTSVRDKCLSPVDVKHVKAAGSKNPVYDLELWFVHNISLAAGKFSKGGFGDVVLGWTKTSGRNNYLIMFQLIAKIVYDCIMIIANRQHTGHHYTVFLECPCNYG